MVRSLRQALPTSADPCSSMATRRASLRTHLRRSSINYANWMAGPAVVL